MEVFFDWMRGFYPSFIYTYNIALGWDYRSRIAIWRANTLMFGLTLRFQKYGKAARVCGMALVVAIGIRETGEREVLGFDLGMSEDGAFWTAFSYGNWCLGACEA